MDHAIEQHFVKTFIKRSRRERLLHELTTPSKRYDGVSRFCHGARDLLEPSRIIMEGEDLERLPAFKSFVRQHGEICYVLTPEFCMDEIRLPLQEALDEAAMSLDAVIIMGSTFAVVFGEPVKGGRGKFLLSEK